MTSPVTPPSLAGTGRADLIAEIDATRAALLIVVHNADRLLSGVDEPCSECGLGAVGDLRGALDAARRLLARE